MHITMVKKQLANGEACRKCQQAEELLKSRGLWDRIDEVVLAVEGDAASAGMLLGARFGIDTAPFFVVRNDRGEDTAYASVLRLVKVLTEGDSHEASHNPPGLALSPSEITRAAAELDGRSPADVLRWALARWGARCTLAFSGAEDVVLIHMATSLGLPFSVFTLDTGRLHPETYKFIEAVRARYGVDIRVLSPDAARLEPFVRTKGLFSFYEDGHEECCAIRKVEPLRRTLAEHDAWVTGQRRDQSPATRSGVPLVQIDPTFSGRAGPLVKINPLAAWPSQEVWDYIRANDVPYNALHERGFTSIGCEPCTRATLPGEHERTGRWWWEETTKRECGLHVGKAEPPR
jgi:phosphoadenosine phosphosulfate reductase